MTLVCWSGGCDSTLVLYELAKQASCFDPSVDSGKPVRAISFSFSQVPANREQARARTRILEWMKARNYPVEHLEVKVDTNEALNQYGNPQATMWLLAQQALRVDEHLYSGYHRGDDFWHNGHHFTETFKALQAHAFRTGQWIFTLAADAKYQIIEKLKKTADPGRPETSLYDLCWWCADARSMDEKEKLRDTPCGKCPSCITHTMALKEIELRAKIAAETPAEQATRPAPSPEELARSFHESYEKLAPSHGYETRKDSAVPWEAVPEKNKKLMIATAGAVLEKWKLA